MNVVNRQADTQTGTHRQTDHATPSVAIGPQLMHRVHICDAAYAMRLNNTNANMTHQL